MQADSHQRFMDNPNSNVYNLPDVNDHHHSNTSRIIAKQMAKKTIKVYESSFDFY